MSHQDDDKLIEGHDYDGIQELDNPLPTWWLLTFFVTIIFGFHYAIYYQFGGENLSSDEVLAAQLKTIKLNQKAEMEKPSSAPVLGLDEVLAEKELLVKGQKLYVQYCASCHADKGQGMIGPNLTDAFWIYSKGEYEAIKTAIDIGFPNKGMPAWGAVIPPRQQSLIAAFVTTLKGTNPPGAKAPQGDKVD